VIERQPGFRGFWAFRDERDPAHAVSASVWNGRGNCSSPVLVGAGRKTSTERLT
jgi:hypothetical protein